jgi:hypothetical protein
MSEVNSLLSDAITAHLAESIVNATDRGGQVIAFRDAILKDVGAKGVRGRMLPDADVTRIGDRCEALYRKRPTIASDSVPALVSAARKLARCAPVVCAMEPKQFQTVAANIDKLKKFCTVLQKSFKDGKGVADAVAAFTVEKKADYKKSTAAHLKALIGMTKYKALDANAKAALVAVADYLRIELSEELIAYRDPVKGRKVFG